MTASPSRTAAKELADAVSMGDRRALARALTAVENRTELAEPVLRRLYPLAGRAHLVGLTGPPGSGKSTLAAALIGEARSSGRSVAVVAVDPSSPITGGALLGDRVRMQAHAGDPNVFIRSMASRGHAGGLSAATAAATAILDAAGFELILIETVGTGQGEVEIAASADVTVVLESPESGDEVQAIKAGLFEVADIVVVNKGDRPGAARTAAQLRAMLGAGRPESPVARPERPDARRERPVATPERLDASPEPPINRPSVAPPAEPAAQTSSTGPRRPDVLVTTATTGEGVGALLAAIERRFGRRRGDGSTARLQRAEAQVWAILADRLRERMRVGDLSAVSRDTLAAVAEHRLDPYAAVERLLAAGLGAAAGSEVATAPAGHLEAAGPTSGSSRASRGAANRG